MRRQRGEVDFAEAGDRALPEHRDAALRLERNRGDHERAQAGSQASPGAA